MKLPYKWIASLAMVVFLAPLVLSAQSRTVIDRIVAVIEDEIVTERELEKRAKPFMGQLDGIADPILREQKRKAVLMKVLDIEIGEKMVDQEISKSKTTRTIS